MPIITRFSIFDMIGSTFLFKEKFVLLINFIESKLEITKAQLSVEELKGLKS